jgi:hypothetical protein
LIGFGDMVSVICTVGSLLWIIFTVYVDWVMMGPVCFNTWTVFCQPEQKKGRSMKFVLNRPRPLRMRDKVIGLE